MDILRRLLNPLGKEKGGKREYKDLSKDSQQVAARPPSELLLFSRDLAGTQIQKHMLILNNCRWIRAEYTYPAFDSMNFMYKNKIFSIIIDIQDYDGNSYLPEEYIKRQLYAAKKNNLIPCKFPVVVDNPHEPDLSTVKALHEGWNLEHTQTNELIFPEQIATTEKIPMSEWEMRNFAIVFVRKYLAAKQLKVLSFQDTLEVDPQIWFEDANSEKCWIVVRCSKYPDTEVPKPEKLKEIIRRCFAHDGYFASIVLTPANREEGDKELYRGGNVHIEFKGFEKIHTKM
ncbi:MAG: hypothetical protein NC200_06835 [Candidatus Gastranaerophilales bacterium]|nr:hypothetical protein [Candidatus Gastranaerophilales bacterium]